MPLRERIGQLFFIGISGPAIDPGTETILRELKPGGVCLFARNIKTPRQTRELLDGIREILPFEPFLSLDQEGGRVDRLRRIVTPMPAADRFTGLDDVREYAHINSEIIRTLGFNMNFAPVVDVIDDDRDSPNNGLYSRAFGRSAADVVELAGAFLYEAHAKSIIACLKHFPGLGAAVTDSHDELPSVDIDEDEFEKKDLAPYRALIDEARMVMVAHAAYPKLALQDRDQNGRLLPSSLSFNFVTELLRNELRFRGVAITDDLEMGAIVRSYGMGEACRMAVNAGNDMLAICASESAIREGFDAVSRAVDTGEISEERVADALARIDELRGRLSAPVSFDAGRIDELSSRVARLNDRLD